MAFVVFGVSGGASTMVAFAHLLVIKGVLFSLMRECALPSKPARLAGGADDRGLWGAGIASAAQHSDHSARLPQRHVLGRVTRLA